MEISLSLCNVIREHKLDKASSWFLQSRKNTTGRAEPEEKPVTSYITMPGQEPQDRVPCPGLRVGTCKHTCYQVANCGQTLETKYKLKAA